MRTFLTVAALIGMTLSSVAQTGVPKGSQSEAVGQMGAAIGATLFEMGRTSDGGAAYVAHGYAEAKLKQPVAGDRVSDWSGEISFRVKELCIKKAQAHVSPLGMIAGAASGAEDNFYVTGVKVETTDAQSETCTFVVNVTYGIKLPPQAKVTQVGYAVYLTGTKRTPESEPSILPRMPL